MTNETIINEIDNIFNEMFKPKEPKYDLNKISDNDCKKILKTDIEFNVIALNQKLNKLFALLDYFKFDNNETDKIYDKCIQNAINYKL